MKDKIVTMGIDPIIPPPAINFVEIKPELSGCGRYAFGSWDILLNKHVNRRIRIRVLTKWQHENRDYSDILPYDLEPQSSFNLGCDFWRGDFELQEFKRSIVEAYYL